MQAALEEAMVNGYVNEVDEVMVRMLLGLAQVHQFLPEEDLEANYQWTQSFLKLLGSYRDSWMERVLVVMKGELGEIFDRRLAELREGLGDTEGQGGDS